MPRLSLKKVLLYLLISVSGLLLGINIHSKYLTSSSKHSLSTHSNESFTRRETHKEQSKEAHEAITSTLPAVREEMHYHPVSQYVETVPMCLNRTTRMDPAELDIPSESDRPWYMEGGQLCPRNSVINKTTGLRNIQLFPEELPGQDRIPG